MIEPVKTMPMEAGVNGKSGGSNESADIAADLIDDLFPNDQEDMKLEEGGMNVNESFTFSPIAVDPQQQVFDFGGQQQQQQSHAFSASPTNQGVGRGRGRGKPVPAWMNQS